MPFKTLVGLARRAGIKPAVLRAIIAKIDSNYRLVRIPKSVPGTFRTLSIPKATLKAVQRVINSEALVLLPTSASAHAYVSGRSILTHARLHVGQRNFIQLDIRDFFPSVTPARVRGVFLELGFGSDVADALTILCTFEGGLPQGAPTSPALSNAVLRQLDMDMEQFAHAQGMSYSRYADDLVLSGGKISLESCALAMDLIEANGFALNLNKSRMMLQPSKVVLTGISISSGVMKVPKTFKRELRSAVYQLLSKGTEAFVRGNTVDPFAVDRAIGRLQFWSRVEPDAAFPRRKIALLRSRYLPPKASRTPPSS